MKQIATVYEMMISSPSDTEQEVAAIFESVTEFNLPPMQETGSLSMIQIRRWNKDVFLNSNMKPQESINEELVERCDFGIAVFKHRLGTPVGDDESGTAQEIRLLRKQKKQIYVFCLDKNLDFDKSRVENAKELEEIEKQKKNLDRYIQKLIKENVTVYRYKNAGDLKNKFLAALQRFPLLTQNVADLQNAIACDIRTIGFGSANNKILTSKLKKAKTVKIFHTIGNVFFHDYVEQLSFVLQNGGNLKILLSNPYSDFLKDLERIEGIRPPASINVQFAQTINYLKEIYEKAREDPIGSVGTIELACSHTLIRQTEIICIDQEDETDVNTEIWCWLSMTMPPLRASTRDSLSFETVTTPESTKDSLAKKANYNFNEVWRVSQYKILLDDETDIPYFYKDKYFPKRRKNTSETKKDNKSKE